MEINGDCSSHLFEVCASLNITQLGIATSPAVAFSVCGAFALTFVPWQPWREVFLGGTYLDVPLEVSKLLVNGL